MTRRKETLFCLPDSQPYLNTPEQRIHNQWRHLCQIPIYCQVPCTPTRFVSGIIQNRAKFEENPQNNFYPHNASQIPRDLKMFRFVRVGLYPPPRWIGCEFTRDPLQTPPNRGIQFAQKNEQSSFRCELLKANKFAAHGETAPELKIS